MATTPLHPPRHEMECRIPSTLYLLSAQRLWEHGVMGQVDVTGAAVSASDLKRQVPRYVDIIDLGDGAATVLGTLADLEVSPGTPSMPVLSGQGLDRERLAPLIQQTQWRHSPEVVRWLRTVERYLYHLSHRQALRGLVPGFWPEGMVAAGRSAPLGLPGLYSKLERYLQQQRPSRHTAEHWLRQLNRAQEKGLKRAELDRSGLLSWLSQRQAQAPARRWTADQLLQALDWSELRVSLLPLLRPAVHALGLKEVFKPPPNLPPVRDGRRAQPGQQRTVYAYDPVLGYRVERVLHPTLWGVDVHWQAVTYEGEPIANQHGAVLLSRQSVARQLAINHAQRRLPKRQLAQRFKAYAWPGGEHYREWLVTLPWIRTSFHDSHFDVRNVLAHVRCDQRVDPAGRNILLIQELQSDWAQAWAQERRVNTAQGLPAEEGGCVPEPPFAREWTSLVLKLMLLHVAWWRLDGLAWLTGEQQLRRFGEGEQWLLGLYDERLPREVNRLLDSSGARVSPMMLRLADARFDQPPASSSASPVESTVRVHGVLLDASTRKAIADTGFAAWG